MKSRLLIVDDENDIREQLRIILALDGYEIETASDGHSALAMLGEQMFHLVITDLRMPGMSGMELLPRIKAHRPSAGLIVMTGAGGPNEAFDALKAGADEFVSKPFDPDHIRLRVRRILERRRLIGELDQLRYRLKENYRGPTIVSKSPKIRKIFDLIEQVGPLGSTVLIGGETGTGKELVAQAIHAADGTRSGPFVAVNCAVLNDSVLESELFGHEKGAFTGAERRKIGRFELANGGTLFLDEIGDTPLLFQSKLLRVLQTGTFERVGGTETIQTNVRIVAATNKVLEDEVRAGRFRSDLFYRLNVIRIELPPLRERKEDIPLLATHFVETGATRHGGNPVREIHSEAMQALLEHNWPGNVRELENAISAAIAMSEDIIRREDLPETVAPRAPRAARQSLIDINRPLPDLTEDLISQVEREYFVRLLRHYRGNVAQSARHSGLSRRSVTQKLQKYGIDRREFKVGAPATTFARATTRAESARFHGDENGGSRH